MSGHDPGRPTDHWYQETHEGTTFFLVMYSRACLWARCIGCSLPSLQSKTNVSFADLMRQTDHVFAEILKPGMKKKLGKIILSNNGSVLDERTFSTTALLYFVAKMNMECPGVRMLTLESRCEYIDEAELEVLARALKEGGANLELAVGFEAFDDKIRNKVFKKGLSLASFEKTVALAARHGFHVKAYFMLKPVVEMTEENAVADIHRAMDYLEETASKHKAVVNMHLNPTYAAKGTQLEAAFREGRYAPPTLETLRRAAAHGKGKKISLYLGLYDEGLAASGGSFIRRGDGPLLKRMHVFNKTQDYSLLGGTNP